ncbi:MAG: hypothetical protein JWQ16_1787, partial [Novosphingobium sp.]|nr:hypothetical protein [Novosphingobium sp.]
MHINSTLRLMNGVAAMALVAAVFPGVAFAQATQPVAPSAEAVPVQADPAAPDDKDIVVTARRRGEESLQVPVVVSAFTGDQLAKVGVNSVTDLARLVPQLSADTNVGSFGGFNTLRGVTSPTSSVSADPAVLVVVDNIPISTGSVNRLGQFDLGRAEVLKGPQALFFGKNSSGGIISLTSAEPTHKFESMISSEYETNAEEWQVNGMVSGPITDSLLGRFAFKGLTERGYFYNDVPGVHRRVGPDPKEIAFRGTLIYEPSPDLTVKFKGTYDRVHDDGTYFVTQRFFCPSGVPSGPSSSPTITDCTIDQNF